MTGRTIMIVDDSLSIRQVVGITLKQAGYTVMEGTDGADALLFKAGDAEAFKSALVRLCGDGALRAKLGAGARDALVRRRFTWRDNAARIAAHVKDLVPGVVTIVGGAHVSAIPERTLDAFPDIDYGVVGELTDPPVTASHSINATSVGNAIDSRSMYSTATARLAEMGLVRVGDGSGRKPCNRASTSSRSM